MLSSSSLLLLNLALALVLTGLIWTIQCVHYPLFASVGEEAFRSYHAQHNGAITMVVAPLMVAELAAAFALTLARPEGLSPTVAWVALGLVLLVWASTFFLSVPSHGRLAQGLSLTEVDALVRGNWVRTLAWTARSGLLLVTQWQLLR